MTSSYRCLLRYNTTEEDNGVVPSSSCFQTQERKNTQENQKKNQEKGRSLPSSSCYALSLTFALSLLPSCFCPFISSVFSWLPLLSSYFWLLVLPFFFSPPASSSPKL